MCHRKNKLDVTSFTCLARGCMVPTFLPQLLSGQTSELHLMCGVVRGTNKKKKKKKHSLHIVPTPCIVPSFR